MGVLMLIGLLLLFVGAVGSLVVLLVFLRRRGARAQSRARARYGSDDESIADHHQVVDIDPPGRPAAATTSTPAAGPSTAAAASAAPSTAAAASAAPSTPASPLTAAAGLATIVTNSILFVAQFTTAVVRR